MENASAGASTMTPTSTNEAERVHFDGSIPFTIHQRPRSVDSLTVVTSET